jgi:hypothetical protein
MGFQHYRVFLMMRVTTATGDSVLTEAQELYMDWLVYGDSRTIEVVASDLGVQVSTLRQWERKPLFRSEWRRLELRNTFSPKRAAEVLSRLASVAVDPEAKDRVSAAKLYLDHAATFAGLDAPVEVDVVTADVEEAAQALLKGSRPDLRLVGQEAA